MLIIVGIISGIVSGLGMGGGTILIIFLTNFLKYEQHIAQANNLIFYIPTSITAIYVHLRNRNVNKEVLIKIIPTCIIGALVGSYFSTKIDSDNLRKYFGFFLLCIGVYEIIIMVKNKIIKK